MNIPEYKNAITEIRRVLDTAGYITKEHNTEKDGYGVSATRDNTCIIVLCTEDISLIQQFDSTPYVIQIHNSKISCKKIIFTENTSFNPTESIIWNRNTLQRYIGNAAIARIYSEPFDINVEVNYPHPQPDDNAESTALPKPDNIIDHPSPIKTTNPTTSEIVDKILPIRINDQNAKQLAHQEGVAVLRMIPYWYYQYKCQGNANYKNKTVIFDEDGYGWINAINGFETDFGTEALPIKGVIPPDAQVIPPVSTITSMKEKINDLLIKKLTKCVRIKTTIGDAIFAEEREMKPLPENLKIDISKVYVPIWQIRGKSDILEVNAYNGEVLTMPSDEGCEVF